MGGLWDLYDDDWLNRTLRKTSPREQAAPAIKEKPVLERAIGKLKKAGLTEEEIDALIKA